MTVTRIGRSLTADIYLEHPSVSRRHALLLREGDETMLVDDASRNGTYLNGERIECAALHDGDVIAVGKVRLRYSASDLALAA